MAALAVWCRGSTLPPQGKDASSILATATNFQLSYMVKYKIVISKESKMVKVNYHLEVPAGGVELISDFSVFVDGKDAIEEKAAGNTKFFGTVFAKLEDETADCPVGFSVTSNTDFSASDSDVLRGNHRFDDASFEN